MVAGHLDDPICGLEARERAAHCSCDCSTNENSNHGQRLPNAWPPGHARKVLNLYQYTDSRTNESASPHFRVCETEASSFATQLGESYRASASDN